MILSFLWTAMVGISILCAAITGNTSRLTASAIEGASNAVSLVIAIGGSVCLWTGVGRLMERCGITEVFSHYLAPLMNCLFPSSVNNQPLKHDLTANITANLLGLGNAATPMGISAAKHLINPNHPEIISDELCRLVVLNTASIQLLPTNIAAIRSALGAQSPFDILPAVWLTSILSAGLGLAAAFILGRLWERA